MPGDDRNPVPKGTIAVCGLWFRRRKREGTRCARRTLRPKGCGRRRIDTAEAPVSCLRSTFRSLRRHSGTRRFPDSPSRVQRFPPGVGWRLRPIDLPAKRSPWDRPRTNPEYSASGCADRWLRGHQRAARDSGSWFLQVLLWSSSYPRNLFSSGAGFDNATRQQVFEQIAIVLHRETKILG